LRSSIRNSDELYFGDARPARDFEQFVYVYWHSSAGCGGFTPVRVAVLPLESLSGDASQDYFADGMTDALITDLVQISALRVISRTSVMTYKRVRKSLPEIARELNVEAVVEGTVSRSGDPSRWSCLPLRMSRSSMPRATRCP
jgi:hypothetical protein